MNPAAPGGQRGGAPTDRRSCGMMRTALLPLLLAACNAAWPAGSTLGYGATPVPGDVYAVADRVNAHRASVGCPPLQWSPALAQVAEAHSFDMDRQHYFGHTDPQGRSPFDRLHVAGITYRSAGENLMMGSTDPDTVLATWLRSPPHRATIENCSFTEQGIGVSGAYWTNLFLLPPG